MVKNKKPGHIDTHRQTNSESPPKSICVYVTRRSFCRWLPQCSLLYLFYQTDTLYKSRTHLFRREPITNRAEPDSPKILFSGPIQIYQHGFELSIHLKAVDGSSRQRPALPSFYYMASRALPSTFSIWQCKPLRFCYLASNAYLYDSVLGKQGRLVRVYVFLHQVRLCLHNFASSVPIRIGTTFAKVGLLR